MKANSLDSLDLNARIHQAALNPHLDQNSFNDICDASTFLGFSGFCPNLNRIEYARKRIKSNSTTKLIGLIAFPFGDLPYSIKLKTAEWAAAQGVDEFEVVPNFSALNEGNQNLFAEELAQICNLGLPVRVILNMSQLSEENLLLAIESSIEVGVKGLQNCNGFGIKSPSNQIRRLVNLSKKRCELKAIGGIRSLDQTIDLVEEGASIIGTTHGPEIMKEAKQWKK